MGRMRDEEGREEGRDGRDSIHIPAKAALGKPASTALPAHTLAPARNLYMCVYMSG